MLKQKKRHAFQWKILMLFRLLKAYARTSIDDGDMDQVREDARVLLGPLLGEELLDDAIRKAHEEHKQELQKKQANEKPTSQTTLPIHISEISKKTLPVRIACCESSM